MPTIERWGLDGFLLTADNALPTGGYWYGLDGFAFLLPQGSNTGSSNYNGPAPQFSATGSETNTGVGAMLGPAAQLSQAPVRLTQMARVVGEDTTPFARLTQLGRVVGEDTTPFARLTQMARQVGYPYQCPSTPTPPSDIPVHILASYLIPNWILERFDQKVRPEDTLAATMPEGAPSTPTWTADGIRWRLNRCDVHWDPQGRLVGPDGGTTTPSGTSLAWQLERLDLVPRTEETA